MPRFPIIKCGESPARAFGGDALRWLAGWQWAWSASAVLHVGVGLAMLKTYSAEVIAVSADPGRASITLTASVEQPEASVAIMVDVPKSAESSDTPPTDQPPNRSLVEKAPARRVVAERAARPAAASQPSLAKILRRQPKTLAPVVAPTPPREQKRPRNSPSLQLTTAITSQEYRGVESPTPAIVSNPPPAYPAAALAASQTGRVLLRVSIAEDGSVFQARLIRSSGFPLLDQAALKTITKWRFNSISDRSHTRVVNVPIDFVIQVR